MLNLNPYETNKLRQLLASGEITESDLASMDIRGSSGPNELARVLSPQQAFAQGDQSGPLPTGSMRNESTGAVTYFKPGGGGFSQQPYPVQAQAAPRARMRVVGVGNDGSQTDMGEEDERALPVDYTRPGIEIPGLGKARYTADGRFAVVDGPDGKRTKVILGYDAAASDRRNDLQLRRDRARAEFEQTNEATGLIRDKRQMLAAGPPRTRTDAVADGPPKPEKMTEAQGKALSFGMRAANASEMLEAVGKGGEIQPGLIKRTAAAVPFFGDALSTATNWTQSEEQQQVERAQRDFINAILRRESGAVISPQEFDNAAKQYFPQPNDDPAVIADKRRARALAISGLEQEVEGVRPGMIKGEAQKARAIFDARNAIKQGAPREAVIQRLRQLGLNETDL
jgi:hypothetical protein